MSLAHARALIPAAEVFPFDPHRAYDCLEKLAFWAMRFSPVVAMEGKEALRGKPGAGSQKQDSRDGFTSGSWLLASGFPPSLLLDISGAAHLFGGETLLLHEIAARLDRLGFTARLAAAPSIGAAWALSHFGPDAIAIVGPDHLRYALAKLPIAALRIEESICQTLKNVGIACIEHLRLPRESLLARFGPALLQRLDQAFNREPELITPIRPLTPLAFVRNFEGAICELEPLMLNVQEVLEYLCQQLAGQESGVRTLELYCERMDAPPVSFSISLGRPSRRPAHLWSLLRPKMETLNMGFGIESVTLSATWTAKLRHQQNALRHDGSANPWAGDAGDDIALRECLDTLINRLGRKRVLLAQPRESHIPERALTHVPLDEDQQRETQRHKGTKTQREKQAILSSSLSAFVPSCLSVFPSSRPSLLFDRPELAEAIALQPDHPPQRIYWRDQEHDVISAVGPERLEPEWWREKRCRKNTTLNARDYFKIQTSTGCWLWLFREDHSRHWFVHGMWT
jgi:protein ImuB